MILQVCIAIRRRGYGCRALRSGPERFPSQKVMIKNGVITTLVSRAA